MFPIACGEKELDTAAMRKNTGHSEGPKYGWRGTTNTPARDVLHVQCRRLKSYTEEIIVVLKLHLMTMSKAEASGRRVGGVRGGIMTADSG